MPSVSDRETTEGTVSSFPVKCSRNSFQGAAKDSQLAHGFGGKDDSRPLATVLAFFLFDNTDRAFEPG